MDPIYLGFFGKAIVIGLSGVGSIYGVTIVANAAIGALKKNPDPFGAYLVLMTPPTTNGLYGFLGYFIFSSFLTPEITIFQATAIFFSCLSLGVLNFFSSYRQSQVCAHAIAAVASGNDIFGKALIVVAYVELYAIIGLAAVYLVAGAL